MSYPQVLRNAWVAAHVEHAQACVEVSQEEERLALILGVLAFSGRRPPWPPQDKSELASRIEYRNAKRARLEKARKDLEEAELAYYAGAVL